MSDLSVRMTHISGKCQEELYALPLVMMQEIAPYCRPILLAAIINKYIYMDV